MCEKNDYNSEAKTAIDKRFSALERGNQETLNYCEFKKIFFLDIFEHFFFLDEEVKIFRFLYMDSIAQTFCL